jgi:hypothetical protein
VHVAAVAAAGSVGSTPAVPCSCSIGGVDGRACSSCALQQQTWHLLACTRQQYAEQQREWEQMFCAAGVSTAPYRLVTGDTAAGHC